MFRHLLMCSGLAFFFCTLWAQSEVISEVRFHGNHSIPDPELLQLSGVKPGDRISTGSLVQIEERLMKSGRLESVDVRQRSRSLTATDEVVLIILIKEKTAISKKFLFFPILSPNDEYGLTYGARVTSIDLLGAEERITFPLSWGGIRQAAAEASFSFEKRFHHEVLVATRVWQRENPHFEIDDRRTELGGGFTQKFKNLRWGLETGWSQVDFASTNDEFVTLAAELTWDTRQDFILPRDAFYASIGWERMAILDGKPNFNRLKLDFRGFKGVWGRAIVAGRFFYHRADGRLPDYQRPFLGGAATLRGHPPGEFVGDNLVSSSVELRLPLHAPLAFYQAGVHVFFDSGAVYDHGQSFGQANFRHGVGGGFFFALLGLGLKVELAYDLDDSLRVHFSSGFGF